jgi:ribonuclease G
MVPEVRERIHYFESSQNIFDAFEVEQQFQKALRHKVWLRSGGAIVMDQTEALLAIDVNSGKFIGKDDHRQMILKTNMEACRVIARQLRLRDLGGLIVIDFIDMTDRDHEKQVLRELKNCLRADRAKYSMSDFAEFGLVLMTRKRVRGGLASAYFRPCPYCDGTARILADSQLWKQLKYDLVAKLEAQPQTTCVDITVHSEFKTYLQASVQDGLAAVAGKYQVAINIVGSPTCHHEAISIVTHVDTVIRKDDKSKAGSRSRGRTVKKTLESSPAALDNAS